MSLRAIDLFAGAGGFSTGAHAAGLNVVWAANHWQEAVDFHSWNHPWADHECQDLMQANWSLLPWHEVGLASPACQGHSRARGSDKPHHDACRSTAWAVVGCAEMHREQLWVVENVVEFLQWELYPAWAAAMKALGYALSPHIVDAADLGIPQNRKRVFIVCTRSKAPLKLTLPELPHVAIEGCLQSAAGGWSPVDTKCEATRSRIEQGRMQHGRRFLMPYYGAEKGGRSLRRPIGTLTTKDRYALVEDDMMRMLTVEECRRAMGFPEDYILPESSTAAKKMLGNAVCPPVAQAILTVAMDSL